MVPPSWLSSDAHGVELRDQREPGVGIVAVTNPGDERPLTRVGESDRAGGDAGHETGALERPGRHQIERSPV